MANGLIHVKFASLFKVRRVLLRQNARTFQRINFSVQGLFYRGQISHLICKLNVHINTVVSVVEECMHGLIFFPKLTICGIPNACQKHCSLGFLLWFIGRLYISGTHQTVISGSESERFLKHVRWFQWIYVFKGFMDILRKTSNYFKEFPGLENL